MVIELTAQNIITTAGLFTALGVLVGLIVKVIHWLDQQKAQDEEIKALKGTHEDDIKSLREELQLQTYGILTCLKGLHEQGCNGPVTKAIEKFEKHLNEEAHK